MSDASRRKTFHVLDTPLGAELRFGALDGFSFEGDIHADTLANLALWLNGVTIDARISSPSHDRAMAEGGWQPIVARSVMQWLEKHLDSVCTKDGLAAGDRMAHQALAEIRRALAPTPTTKEETA